MPDTEEEEEEMLDASTCKKVSDKLFPATEAGVEIGWPTRIWRFFFPFFSLKTFTFWFSLFFLGWNIFIQFMYMSKKEKMNNAMECQLLKYGAGSCTAYQRYKYQYYRPLLSTFTADSLPTTIIGWLILWMHGFEYEHYYKLGPVLFVTFGGGLLGTLIGDFFIVNPVRGCATATLFSFLMIRFLVISEQYKDSIFAMIIVLLGVVMKIALLLMLSATSVAGDLIATMAGAGFGVLLTLAILKGLHPDCDPVKAFKIRRGQIFMFTSSIFCLLFGVMYAFVIYDDKETFEAYEKRYTCEDIVS